MTKTVNPQVVSDRSKATAADIELAMGASALGIFAGAAFAAYGAVLAASSLLESVLPELPVEPG